jgi:hypothetical protein
MRKIILAAILTFASITPLLSGDQKCLTLEPAQDNKYRPGQVWHFKTRPGEENSVLTILKIESAPKIGTILHVRVDGVRLRNCTGGPEPDNFEHMPFTRDAIERSVTKLAAEKKDIPPFEDGYDEWRKACGGVYTITVAEAIAAGEVTFRKSLGCPTP